MLTFFVTLHKVFTMDKKRIKLRIKEILKEKGLFCRDVAEKTGKRAQYISGIVNGGKPLSLNTLLMVADALDVEFADLFESSRQSAAEMELISLFIQESAFPSDGNPAFAARLLNSIHKVFFREKWKAFVADVMKNPQTREFVGKCRPYLSKATADDIVI